MIKSYFPLDKFSDVYPLESLHWKAYHTGVDDLERPHPQDDFQYLEVAPVLPPS